MRLIERSTGVDDVNTAASYDQNEAEPGVRMTGHVKWFDPAKGYGFVIPESADGIVFSSDVMVHVSCLRAYGENTADEGARIICDVVQREKGWQVLTILEMDRPRAALAREAGNEADFELVTVKWFNTAKGFGFVNRPGSDEDVFIHISVMRKAGLETLEPGTQLEVVIGEGKKGRNAVLIKKA